VSVRSVLTLAALAACALPVAAADARRPAPRLAAFDSCTDLVRYARANLVRTHGAVGVPMRASSAPATLSTPPLMPIAPPGQPVDDAGVAPPVVVATPTAAAPEAGGAGSGGDDFSGTNTHETGIDEPDLVKTDGHRLYTVVDGTLHVVDLDGGTPTEVATLPLEGSGHQLLLRGTRLLVTASKTAVGARYPIVPGTPVPAMIPFPTDPETLLTEVNVADPAHPAVARTMTVRGTFVDARQHENRIRLVIASTPKEVPVEEGETQDDAIAGAGLRTFVPRTVLRSRVSGRTFKRELAKCREIRRPRQFAGNGLLTVMTVDLDRGLYSVDRDAVMAGAQVVYGNGDDLFVASQKYDAGLAAGTSEPTGPRTEIHRFTVDGEGRTVYAGSGEVPGYLLNQYALSSYDGVLRVATTEDPPWEAASETESGVSTLKIEAGRLAPLARLGGLGRGERIQGVRFLGETGYVVTFRQTDPLYVVDLRDPAKPRATGELKITGYSAYLHPAGDGLLIGVGQEATDQGRRLGAQVSLFDVSDPAAPKRLQQRVLGSGSTAAEGDPHAFLYWPKTQLTVLPYSDYASPQFDGAVGMRVRRAGIDEVGRIDHRTAERPYVSVVRTMVVRDRVLSLSYRGVGASTLDTLAPAGFAAF
jgi:hypothetical protein